MQPGLAGAEPCRQGDLQSGSWIFPETILPFYSQGNRGPERGGRFCAVGAGGQTMRSRCSAGGGGAGALSFSSPCSQNQQIPTAACWGGDRKVGDCTGRRRPARGGGGPVWVLETERQEALKHPHAAHRDPVWDAQTRAGPFPPQMPSSQPSDGAPGAPALPARV